MESCFPLASSHRRGRPKAKVAAARKLLINCYIMLRDGIGYEEFRRRGEVGLCEGSGELGPAPGRARIDDGYRLNTAMRS